MALDVSRNAKRCKQSAHHQQNHSHRPEHNRHIGANLVRRFGRNEPRAKQQNQKQATGADGNAQLEYDRLTSAGRAKLAAFPKPVIACIRGFCLGGGLGIAMQADLRIAGGSAQFGIPAARLGIAYSFEMVERLISLVGQAHARMIIMTGDRMDALEAQRVGLVNRVVPDEDLTDTVLELAKTISANAPLSLRATKLTVNAVMATESQRNRAGVDAAILACFDSADYREGRTAFMEKRPAKWQGQ